MNSESEAERKDTIPSKLKYKIPVSDLAEGFAKYYKSGQLCDAEIHAAGKVFRAHRVILAAASPYFEALYLGDFEESKSEIPLKLKVCIIRHFWTVSDQYHCRLSEPYCHFQSL